MQSSKRDTIRYFSEALRALRKLEGASQQDVAERSKVSLATVHAVENTARSVNVITLEKIALAFNRSPKQMVELGASLMNQGVPPLRVVFGKNVKERRKLLGYSLRKLAGLSEMSTTYLRNIEAGEQNPTLDKVESLANALEVGYVDLLRDDVGDL